MLRSANIKISLLGKIISKHTNSKRSKLI